MLAHRNEVWDLIEKGAAIFVCGNANTMAPGVRAALADIYRDGPGGSAADAQAWLADLRAADRFVEDIWGGRAFHPVPAPSGRLAAPGDG
jgi:cytochrome P450/NADPH-cytochrome P450 reductase